MVEMGYPNTNLDNKCATCKFYSPLIMVFRHTKLLTKFARGHCEIRTGIFQRTCTCKKFEQR